MSLFRRSGSYVALLHDGALPAAAAMPELLEKHRFRTIESAASEEVSVGWVTASDPTGDAFAAEDLEAGTALWLRMRIDKKTLPKVWVDIHRTAAERAAGRRLSVRERRELREDLMDKLLPRVLPAVRFVDALLRPERRQVLLFASGTGTVEAFGKLFFETFGLPLQRVDPLVLGLHCGLSPEMADALERAGPLRRERRSDPAVATATATVEPAGEAEA